MARGYIYYITTDRDASVSFGESDYYEKLDSIGADYVQDVNAKDSEEPLEGLMGTMSGMGAETAPAEMPGFAFTMRFGKVEQMLENYFKPRLEKLKKEAAKLDLSSVIRSGPSLDYICNNQYGDAVELHDAETNDSGTFLTLDDFVRQIRPGATYYVYGKLVLMH